MSRNGDLLQLFLLSGSLATAGLYVLYRSARSLRIGIVCVFWAYETRRAERPMLFWIFGRSSLSWAAFGAGILSLAFQVYGKPPG
jgi:hypothetical protein